MKLSPTYCLGLQSDLRILKILIVGHRVRFGNSLCVLLCLKACYDRKHYQTYSQTAYSSRSLPSAYLIS